jgi:hypothetical protein
LFKFLNREQKMQPQILELKLSSDLNLISTLNFSEQKPINGGGGGGIYRPPTPESLWGGYAAGKYIISPGTGQGEYDSGQPQIVFTDPTIRGRGSNSEVGRINA